MFESVLIANRGEIACRIIKTARKMGLRTVAVYSDADADALHVQMADQAVNIGPPPATESYLCADRIFEAARQTHVNAIHPGYGFLSEQPDLVTGCAENGVIWVGPHLDAILSMGSKIEAKKIAQNAGVPCIPGYSDQDQSDKTLISSALGVGLPVMIKASAGGGGKGMRAVFNAAELPVAIASARTEAKRAFGDDRLLVEKLIQNPRHIEVQLLGDKHGNMLHLFERDCSVQRNHQKLLEEAPAPNLRDDTRTALYETAVRLGRTMRYDSTGTVEFIMDAETETFYFLEVNTRLQVEHTVTEEVTGLDLVEQQFRVASGEALHFTQDQVTCTGHAIEARLTAEDAADNFRPETGTILHWATDPNLRCDSGVQTGSVIGANYDSMIAKLIAHGSDRDIACRKLAKGLEQLEVAGLKTNRLFLRDAIQRDRFATSRATTDFLFEEWPEGWQPTQTDTFAIAALALHIQDRPALSPWTSLGGFRLLQSSGHPATTTYRDTQDTGLRLDITETPDGYVLSTPTASGPVQVKRTNSTQLTITRNGVQNTVGALIGNDRTHVWGHDFDAIHGVLPLGNFDAAKQGTNAPSPHQIIAPMPGLIVELRATPNATVTAGETLVVMESMKLLMELKAAVPGTIGEIKTGAGETVDANAMLIQLIPSEKED